MCYNYVNMKKYTNTIIISITILISTLILSASIFFCFFNKKYVYSFDYNVDFITETKSIETKVDKNLNLRGKLRLNKKWKENKVYWKEEVHLYERNHIDIYVLYSFKAEYLDTEYWKGKQYIEWERKL